MCVLCFWPLHVMHIVCVTQFGPDGGTEIVNYVPSDGHTTHANTFFYVTEPGFIFALVCGETEKK